MIVQRFLIAYKKNPKLVLDLYNEVYGIKKDSLSEEEIRKLHRDTLKLLENLLNTKDLNDALTTFFSKIKQLKYAGHSEDFKYLILSSAVNRKNNEILKKYIDSKDNQKVARIIDYLGKIGDASLSSDDKNKFKSVYEIELKEPEELSSINKETNDVNEDKIKDNNSGFKDTIYNFLSSVGNKIRDIAVEIDKFFRKIAGYEYVRDFLKDLINNILYVVVDYPKVVGLAGLMTLVMIYSTHSLKKVLNSDYNSLAISIRSLSNKFSNINILTNRFIKAGVKVSVMASSVYLLRKIFSDIKRYYRRYYMNEREKYLDLRSKTNPESDLYSKIDATLIEIKEKLTSSGYKKLLNIIKSKFGKKLLESSNVITGIVKFIYAVLWILIVFITNIAFVLNEMFNIKSNRLKIIGILTALGISNVI
ncbi:MAG: hypothetical protein ACP5G1_03060 [Nanopusillaceae archaeon]